MDIIDYQMPSLLNKMHKLTDLCANISKRTLGALLIENNIEFT